MTFKKTILILMISFLSSFAQEISIVPLPAKVEKLKGNFVVSEKTKIWIEPGKEMQSLGDLLSATINGQTGLKLSATWKMTRDIPKSLIQLETKKDFSTEEGYNLFIKSNLIKITAKNGTGIFYALQSLFQLMPTAANSNKISLPCSSIQDYPRFKWRGVHLDVSRHFFPVAFIKKYIDMLSLYKMNTFHWHLTDDQGWRIEIKKYPKLTEVAAWRKDADGITYGGFYTQDQIKEVVAYAKKHYITVVPEIEMPGHALAALAAYPEYSCTGGPFLVGNIWGVLEDVFCAGNEKTFEFLQDVLTEVFDLFPGEIIHVGGDEVPKVRWKDCIKCQTRIKTANLKDESELQSYFTQRIEKFINSKGRKIIGWDEILEGGLAPNALVMSWRGIDGGIAAAKAKHFVVMSPGTHCYFDYNQAHYNEPKGIGGYITLEKVYSYEPVPDVLNNEEAKYILGAQANLWTEYISMTDHLEYMLMPRMIALSEVLWSTKESRNLKDFIDRMSRQYSLLASKNINFRFPSPLPDETELLIKKSQIFKLDRAISNSLITYTLDGREPTITSSKYIEPLEVQNSIFIKTKVFLPNEKSSQTSSLTISAIDSVTNGLNYKYYENTWDHLPNFDSFSALRNGTMKQLNISDLKPADNFGIVIESFLNIENDDSYTFYLTSNDGSNLLIDNALIVDNGGMHGTRELSGKTFLAKGKHSIKILYFNRGGTQKLKLEFESASITKRIIPASSFLLNN
jgi:hexosaminidase